MTNIFYTSLAKLQWTFSRDPFSNFVFENGQGKTIFRLGF